jgi:sulfoxide reductase heme-binding subunit YedZ
MSRLLRWRLGAWGLALIPLVHLVWRGYTARLGANPVEFVEHYSGDWSLRLLLVTLALTPLRRFTGLSEPIRIRRLLGLWCYAWLCLHFATYLVFDLELSAWQLGQDLVKRSYITLGFTAWLFLSSLALTSTQGWQRRLKRNWKRLHRLIYPAALLGVLHYWWLVKADVRMPLVYLSIFIALMLMRLERRAILRPSTTG